MVGTKILQSKVSLRKAKAAEAVKILSRSGGSGKSSDTTATATATATATGTTAVAAATITPFRRRVYEAVSEVPAGRVTTYKLLAVHVGCGSARAVGQALRRNPFAPGVPCHRVVATDRGLGGFCGARAGGGGPEVARKRRLLEGEGVRFDPDGKVEPSCLFAFRE
jgi:methylated-DNA-[protein]-cysteine S-methyltransferase